MKRGKIVDKICLSLILSTAVSTFHPSSARASGDTFFGEVINGSCAAAADKNHAVATNTACTIRVFNTYFRLRYWLQYKDGRGVWRSSPTKHTYKDGNGDGHEDFRFRANRSQWYRLAGDLNGNNFPDITSQEFRIYVDE